MIKPPAQWSIDLLAQEAITRMCKTGCQTGKSRSNQPGTKRLHCILLLFTSAPLSARTATWRNYSRLTLLRKKELLSGQVRQKSWLKEAAQSRASRRERERVKSIAPSGRLDTILLSRYEQLSGNTKRSTVLNCFWKQSTVPVATWSTPRLPPDAHESVVEAADAS